MDLSIIVVNWNTRDFLARCLGSIYDTVAGITYEVIVVDNASEDGSADMVAQSFPQAHLLRNRENFGFARANNQAIDFGCGRYVLLLNSDALLLPGTVQAMVSFLDGHPSVGLVGGLLLNPDGSFQSSYADFPTLWSEFLLMTKLARLHYPPSYPFYPPERSEVRRAVDWMMGALLMVRRQTVAAVGGMDEEYFMYSEETDWCYRIRRAGWAIYYLPEARALHWGGQSARHASPRRRAQLYRSKWLLLRKHHGALAAAAFHFLVWLTSTLKLVTWSAVGLLSNKRRHEAWQNAASYRLLLADF